MGPQWSRQQPHERGEHGPVRPLEPRSRVGAAQDGDFVAQHEELDVLGGGRAAQQQNQPEHLHEDQVQQPQRHVGIMSHRRSPLVSDPGPTSGTPQAETQEGKVVSVSLWESAEQAQQANELAASWVKENLADRVRLESGQVGDFLFYETA
jgi:hypothetical protein